jgi:chromosome segregation ATPase
MNSIFGRLGPSELLPRYIFAESLFVRRRVLEVGAVASTRGRSAQFLALRGARSVIACDGDLTAVDEAQKSFGGPSLHFRANVFDDMESGSFDLLLVADLSDYVRAPELLKELRRLIAQNGYLLGGIRNPAGLALAQLNDPEGPDPAPTYGQLLDALSPLFPSVEVATQSPILGYQLAFERSEGLQVDGSLASAGEAAYFVVIAGQEPSRSFEPTWVQLPPEPLAFIGTRVDEYSHRNRDLEERSARLMKALEKSRQELAAREAELSRLKGQLEGSRESEARLGAQLESVRDGSRREGRGDQLAAKISRLESELKVATERIQAAERRSAQQLASGEQSERMRIETEAQVSAAQEVLRLERARRQEVADLLEDAKAQLAQAQGEVRAAHDEAAALRAKLERQGTAGDRSGDEREAGQRELEAARDRELALAERSSRISAEAEKLQAELAAAREEKDATAAELVRKEAQLQQALRIATQHSKAAEEARQELERERQQREVTASSGNLDRASLEVEFASAQAEAARLSRELDSVSESERRLRDLTAELEDKLAAARDEGGIDQMQRELEEAKARGRRLEHDISTAVAAERSAREQAQVALSEAQARLLEVAQEHNQSVARAHQLEKVVDELRQAGEAEAAGAASYKQRAAEAIAEMEEGKASLESALAEVRAREAELSSQIGEFQERVSSAAAEALEAEERSAAVQEKLDAAEAESDRLRAELQARGPDERAEQEKAQAALRGAQLEAGRIKDELLAFQPRLHQAQERARRAQAESEAARVDLQTLRERLESADAEKRILEDDRARLTDEVERLEAERARKTEEIESANRMASQRQAELSAAASEKEARMEILQRRLTAQESELAILRRTAPRSPPSQVQQIYERAAAELTAVKAELFRRPPEPGQAKRRPPEQLAPTEAGASPSALSKQAGDEKADRGRPSGAAASPPSGTEKHKP